MDINLTSTALLRLGATLSFAAALLHIGIIFGGPSWYRFFGAGEGMAQAAAAGKIYPALITAAVALVLGVWGLYALSGAGDITRLPLLKSGLAVITGIYLIRGLAFAPLLWNTGQYSIPFMLWSSAICLGFGLVHLAGLLTL